MIFSPPLTNGGAYRNMGAKEGGMPMATIEDIAREAGVSATTVSNVIHGNTGKVSPQTLQRISEIIRRRGYVPNLSARAMKTRTSRVVALIRPPESRSQPELAPLMGELVDAVERTLGERGYFLMLRTVATAEALRSFLSGWNVQGLILPGLYEDDPLCPALEALRLPVVLTDSYSSAGNIPALNSEDFAGAQLATEHLIALGHRRIAFAGSAPRAGGVARRRLMGYRAALAAAGLPHDPALELKCDFTADKMAALGAQLAQRQDITAALTSSDLLAAGLLSGIVQSGGAVPRDLSLVGFGGLAWGQMTAPRLTTVREDAAQKGRAAAECILRLLEGGPAAPAPLPTRLIPRGTTAPPAQTE